MNNIIELSNYQMGADNALAAQANMSELNELRKALEVGHLRGGDPNSLSGGALKVESLERTLKDLQFKEADIALWRMCPNLPAYSTVEEYNRLLDYGQDDGGFIGEGDLPEESDNTYERVAELVKYIGTVRSTTIQAQLVSTNVGDLKLHQTKTGTKWVLRKSDRALFAGDAATIPHEWNGVKKLHQNSWTSLTLWNNSPNVIDLRGSYLTEGKLQDASKTITDNHGAPDTIIGSTQVLSEFVKQYHEAKFIQPNTPAVAAGEMGQRVKVFHTAFTSLNIHYDKFMNDQAARYSGDLATHEKAPAVPVKDGNNPVLTPADPSSKFIDGQEGDYFVGVAAINRFGQSPICMLSNSLVTVADGDAIDIKFTAGAGSFAPTGYAFYISEKDPTTALAATPLYPVFKVSTAQLADGFDGCGALSIRNRNRFIPNTGKALVFENDMDIWAFKQLAPMMKMDLARVSTADRFMLLLFGTPQMYAPKKFVIVINAGNYTSS